MRVQRRRRGLDGRSTHASGATHVIKIGFSTPGKSGGKQPHKLPGFLIYHDSIDGKGAPCIDDSAQRRLGVSLSDIDTAKKLELKAPEGTLPTELHVIIQNDARRDDNGDWEYPGVFAESLECFTKIGVLCTGNGHRAMRRKDDGTKEDVACVPEGATGTQPEEWCEYSTGKAGPNMKCKSHSRLTVCVFVVGPDGIPVPLSESLGISARYRIDTHSDYNAIGIQETLDGAADQLDGHIGGLTGILKFQRQSKRMPEGSKVAAAPVGQISLHLSPEDIARQKARLGGWQLDGPMEAPPRMLEGLADNPQATGEVTPALVIEPESEPEDDAPDFDNPEAAEDEEVRLILEYSESYKIDLAPVLKKAGKVLGTPVGSLHDLTATQRAETLDWLKAKAKAADEGEGR